MRVREHCWVVAAVASVMVLGSWARAQTPPCTAGLQGVRLWVIGGSRANVPFSGTVKTSFEQKLLDGNTIHEVMISHNTRDSAGRMMSEMASGCERGEDGQMHERLNVSVNDPVARTNTNWQVGGGDQLRVAQIFHQPEPQPAVK